MISTPIDFQATCIRMASSVGEQALEIAALTCLVEQQNREIERLTAALAKYEPAAEPTAGLADELAEPPAA